MKIVDLSVQRPIGVVMIVIAILALGFVSLGNTAIDLYPKIDLPIAVVSTSYQGAGPEEIENLISKPLESVLSSLQGIDTIQSQSQANASMVLLMFDSGVKLDDALYEVREKVDQVKGFLPEDADDPAVLRFDPQQMPVVWLGLSGASLEELQEIAEDQVEPILSRVKGAASVSIQGGRTREILIELDQAKLTLHGLTSAQIMQSLSSENQSASAGVVSKGTQNLQIRVDGEYTSIEDIGNTLIMLPQGGSLKLKDVSTIKDTFKEITSITKVNNEHALIISVLKKSDGNTVQVADGILKSMNEINEVLPRGVELSVVMDTSVFIKQSISSVFNNMVTGGIFSILVLILFLRSIRATLVIGVSIPIAIVSTFILMYFTGQTVNILSMGGLALGIGMMVDSSIVILENVYDYRQRGYSIKEAAKLGAAELAPAVIASTTTTLVVFLPIVFVQGLASDLFTPLALTVSFSLIASLVVAVTLVPMLSSQFLVKYSEKQQKENRFDRAYNRLMSVYKRALKWSLNHRKSVIGLTVLAMVLSLGLSGFVGAEFIPSSDQGQIQVSIETPSGSQLSETQAVAEKAMISLEKYEDVIESHYVTIGGGGFDPTDISANSATLTIQMVPASERDMTTKQLLIELNEQYAEIPGAEIEASVMGASISTGDPIEIGIIGQDQVVLEQLAEQVEWLISEIPGTHNVSSSASEGRPELQVQVDREMASQYGLTYQQVMDEVQTAFVGKIATRYREDGGEYDVRIILPEEQREEIRNIEQLNIQTASGQLIPLSTVAKLEEATGPSMITRENQQRRVNVSSELLNRDLASVTYDIQTVLATMNFPDGYTYTMGGQTEDMIESFTKLALALVFSIFLVYLVMAVQFESILHPFIIMFSMPTSLVGIFIGLFITGKPFSIPAFIGIIMLAGIVVNNAIILVDYINILRRRGMDRNEAILDAGPSRVRPILMTTLTTVLGMIPLALGLGEGAEAQAPLAVVIIFGLSVSTVFTLILIPVMYTYMDDLSNKLSKLIKWRPKWRKPKASKTKEA